MSTLVAPARRAGIAVGPAGAARPRLGLHRLAVLALLVLLALAIAASATARASAGGGPGARSITVAPGQTLSHIAVRELPELPVGTAVAEIQLANRLNTTHVHAGQQLVIPPVR